MTSEASFIDSLRALARDPAARGLVDDAAVLEVGGARLVLTHDMIVENVHYLRHDAPGDVAWKLVAVNLSDLAAKGAAPLGVLLGYSLGDAAWDQAFARGLGVALSAFALPLLGGDTVSPPKGNARALGLTAIGIAGARAPSRADGCAGEILWVSGTIGDAGAGLAIATGKRNGPAVLADRYRTPLPRLAAGQALAAHVSAMMDVSDGLLIDAARMAAASKVAARIDLDAVPLSDALLAFSGEDRTARLAAVTAGDDYELLFSAPEAATTALLALSGRLGLSFTRIGRLEPGSGLTLADADGPVPLPPRLGYEHRPG